MTIGYSVPNIADITQRLGEERILKTGWLYRKELRPPAFGVQTIIAQTEAQSGTRDWIKQLTPMDSNDFALWRNGKLNTLVVYSSGVWEVYVGTDAMKFARMSEYVIKRINDRSRLSRDKKKPVKLGPRKLRIRKRT